MLTKLELQIKYEHKERLGYNISSLLHGIIMTQIDSVYAEFLHQNGQKPFSVSVTDMTDSSFTWTICTLNKVAKEKIIDVLFLKQSFYMEHKKLELHVTGRKLSEITYEELIERFYFGRHPRNILIRFQTPTAFKSDGKYVFLPNVHFFFQSLMNKYNAFSEETSVDDPEVLEYFEQHVFIKKYKLRSVRYCLEGVWIPSFVGEITLHIDGSERMVNLAHMLIAFGEYAGVGIKCALGMGHIERKGGEICDRNTSQTGD